MKPNTKRNYNLVYCWFAMILLGVGFIGWFGAIFINLNGDFIPNSIQLPYGQPNAISVSKKGDIYIGSNTYHRIFVYDSKGHFIKSHYIRYDQGNFVMQMDKNEYINIFTAYHKKHIVLDYEFKVILIDNYTNSFDVLVQSEKRNFMFNGEKYFISGFIYPQVIKVGLEKRKLTIISSPLYLWVFSTPIPSWIFAFFGLFLLGAMSKKKKSRALTSTIFYTR
jgi:hypothetical protein